MTRFTDRVERDLSQISDRATPSSTAWEAIQQRIDEQDNRAANGTQPTMEVIMLDPDTNKYSKRPRTGLLVAACLGAAALVGGLVVIGARDDETLPADRPDPTVPVDDAAIGGDPDAAPVDIDAEPPTEPDAAVDPVDETVGEVLPSVGLANAGSADATCAFGAQGFDGGRTILEQTCTFDETSPLPFEAVQALELTVHDARAVEGLGAAPYASVADSGLLSAGYSYARGGLARFVGVADGVGGYEGQQVTITGLGEGNVDATFDWNVDDMLGAPLAASDSVSEITIECELGNYPGRIRELEDAAFVYDQECTFSGGAAGFVPGPLAGEFRTFDSNPGDGQVVPEVGGFTFFTTTFDDEMLFSGLLGADGDIFFVSVWSGTGDLEGTLIHGVGRAQAVPAPTDDDPTRQVATGVIQVTALPVSL
jgi:hypothetical protein